MRCVRFFRDRKASGVTVEVKETLLDPASHPAELEKSDKSLAVRQALCRISSACRKLLAPCQHENLPVRTVGDAGALGPHLAHARGDLRARIACGCIFWRRPPS